MYHNIIKEIETQVSKEEFTRIKEHTIHLGVFTNPCFNYMLEGKKTIESRITKKKIAPYDRISVGDTVFVKKSGGDIVAYFTIKKVLFVDLAKESIWNIKEKYGEFLCVNEDFWQNKKDSQYATLLFIEELVKIKPFPIEKKGMQSWVVFDKE